MITLIVLVVLLAVWVEIDAVALSLAAKSSGSKKPKVFQTGQIAALAILGIGLVLTCAVVGIASASPGSAMAAAAGSVIALLALSFPVVMKTFALPAGRALAPVGAVLASVLVMAAVVLLVIKPTVAQSLTVSTDTMMPTLAEGQQVVVEDLVHPQRWDLVVYRHGSDVMCMRVIGLPGEKICFAAGGIYINSQSVIVPPVINGRMSATNDRDPDYHGLYEENQTIPLGADEYFCVGDKLDNNVDSRVAGPIKQKDLIGVADLVYWPPAKFHILR